MPWRDLLSPTQRVQVMALPTSLREYEELYTLTPADLDFVAVHRTHANRVGVAVALRALGKIERTLFLLQYISSVELRRRIHVGLNKGEAKNALARAVFFNRLGELRDRTHENQRHRASGLNLVVAAIVLWNTIYLERAVAAIRETGQAVSDETLAHLSPLKWEHINLTGDYHWRKDAGLRNRKLRPLRVSKPGLVPQRATF